MVDSTVQIPVSLRVLRHLVLAALVLSVLLPVQAAVAAETSRFQRLVAALEQADPASRSTFARIALLEMAEIHIAEAGLARQQATEDTQSERLLGWSFAVELYARDLLGLHDDVEQGAPVVLLPAPLADAGILVGPQGVMISHPRGEQQAALEQAILKRFCAQEDCLQLLSANREHRAEPIFASPVSRPPSWSFTPLGPVCQQDGLRVQFPVMGGSSAGSLGHYRSLCQQLFAELQQLAAELQAQLRQGVVPQWAALVVSANPHRPEHTVRLNSAGDSILLAVPLLHSTPGLLARLIPWLRPLVESGPATELLLQAADLGWLDKA